MNGYHHHHRLRHFLLFVAVVLSFIHHDSFLLHFFSQVLVNSLANSKTFQRFAIRSNAALSDAAKKGVEHHSNITEKSTEFIKAFREEVSFVLVF